MSTYTIVLHSTTNAMPYLYILSSYSGQMSVVQDSILQELHWKISLYFRKINLKGITLLKRLTKL